jgi:hypothetical protein
MVQFRFKPIERWPKEPTRERRRSNFKSTYGQTMKLLVRELEHLDVGEAFIYLWLGFGQIKKDGTPYADARPTQPGVILHFTGRHGSQTFPCDKYADWQDNLRCIALTLESCGPLTATARPTAASSTRAGPRSRPPAIR